MDAGTEKYMLAFVYDSDDDVPIGAADPKYVPGLMRGTYSVGQPRPVVRTKSYWLANNANPGGFVKKKIPVHLNEINYKCMLVDAMPFYWTLGKVTGDSPSADIFTIQGSVDGDVPTLICHEEFNQLSNEQAKEYEDVKHVGAKFYTDDGVLWIDMTAVAQRELNMTDNLVVRSTVAPVLRGTVAPKQPYKTRGNSGLTLTWNSKSFGSYFESVTCQWENDISGMELDDGLDYADSLFNAGKRTYSDIVMTFVLKAETNDIDDLEQYRDGTTTSDLVLKVPRRHANDYLQVTWKDVILRDFAPVPSPNSDPSALPAVKLVFGECTDIVTYDAQATSAGVAAPNADADYEL